MMKESFEDFKRLIKEWLDTHPKEYGSFVEEMNRKDSAGFQKVFMLVVKIVPKYKDEVKKRMFNDTLKVEKPLYFDPFGQIEFAHFGHNIIAPCKVLV